MYETKEGLKIIYHSDENQSIIIPLDIWLRSQLMSLQTHVVDKVTIPASIPIPPTGKYIYKPICIGNNIAISISHWCSYYGYNHATGVYETVKDMSRFQSGQYNCNIEVSHVYIGPHKNGQNFSISLRVTQIMYKSESEASGQHIPLDTPDLTVKSVKSETKKRGGRKVKNELS